MSTRTFKGAELDSHTDDHEQMIADEENGGVRVMNESKKFSKQTKLCIGGTICGLIIGSVCIGLIIYSITQKPFSLNEIDSIETIEDLELTDDSAYNISHKQKFIDAYNVWDLDNDNKLNRTEFSNFAIKQAKHGKLFETIDVNGDGIISFAEGIAYVDSMYNINKVFNEEQLEHMKKKMLFAVFDINKNGYILEKEFLRISAANEFVLFDRNSDNFVDINEFVDVIYGDSEYSWKVVLKQMYGDNYEEIMSNLHKPNSSDVNNIKINHCNGLFDDESDENRRLAAGWCIKICYGSYGCFWYCS